MAHFKTSTSKARRLAQTFGFFKTGLPHIRIGKGGGDLVFFCLIHSSMSGLWVTKRRWTYSSRENGITTLFFAGVNTDLVNIMIHLFSFLFHRRMLHYCVLGTLVDA